VRPAALALTIAVLPLVGAANLPAQAQSFVRSPNLNIGPRIPTINATPRINPNVATVRTISPNLNVRQSCSYAYRTSDGQCSGQPVSTSGGGGTGNGSAGAGRSGGSRNNVTATNPNQRITNELVAEIDGALTDRQADALARRHRLIRLGSQNFPLIGATIGRFRIADSRSADAASRDFASDASVHAVQPNFRYVLQEQQAIPTEGDPAQYAVAKLRLAERIRSPMAPISGSPSLIPESTRAIRSFPIRSSKVLTRSAAARGRMSMAPALPGRLQRMRD